MTASTDCWSDPGQYGDLPCSLSASFLPFFFVLPHSLVLLPFCLLSLFYLPLSSCASCRTPVCDICGEKRGTGAKTLAAIVPKPAANGARLPTALLIWSRFGRRTMESIKRVREWRILTGGRRKHRHVTAGADAGHANAERAREKGVEAFVRAAQSVRVSVTMR